MRGWLVIVVLAAGCARPGPPVSASAPSGALQEPQEGWYDGACLAALAGDVDLALRYLAQSIALGQAPLDWMAEDPDLASVRADARYDSTRDDALRSWLAAQRPTSGSEWMAVARTQALLEEDPAQAVKAAEAAGYHHAVFDPPLPPVTPALEQLVGRRSAWIEAKRNTVTVEIPAAFELANIVLSQTAYGQDPNATDRSSTYSREVDAWFGPHRDHPLIRELDALPVDMGAYYAFRNQSAAWTLQDGKLSPSAVYRVGGFWGGPDPFAARIEGLEDYVRVTHAQDFLDAHQATYEARIAAYEGVVPIRAMWDWLEARFPAEGDGRDALVVRSSPLIGGSHNASTLALDGFTEGTMVAPLLVDGDAIAPEHVGPLARMIFTEIDHHYVNPVSARLRSDIDRAIPDVGAFNEKAAEYGYATPFETFNEYATWVLFDVWWAEHCDAQGCSDAQRRAGAENTDEVMLRRGFHRYPEFRRAVVPSLQGQQDLEACWPLLLEWFRSS